MIGIALKSQKAGDYINEIMGLEQENQEELGAIVQNCLDSITEDSSGRSSSASQGDNSSSQAKKKAYRDG